MPLRMLAYCLMPNHFHLVLRPYEDGDLSRWMQWLLTAHVRRYHRRDYHSSGHVRQGRFKALGIEADGPRLTVVRDVERNPRRADRGDRAEHWRGLSMHGHGPRRKPAWLSDPPPGQTRPTPGQPPGPKPRRP